MEYFHNTDSSIAKARRWVYSNTNIDIDELMRNHSPVESQGTQENDLASLGPSDDLSSKGSRRGTPDMDRARLPRLVPRLSRGVLPGSGKPRRRRYPGRADLPAAPSAVPSTIAESVDDTMYGDDTTICNSPREDLIEETWYWHH